MSKNKVKNKPLLTIYQIISWPLIFLRSAFFSFLKKSNLSPEEDLTDLKKDNVADFDEYPNCEMCKSKNSSKLLDTKTGQRIVKCNNCGLSFTSPRIKEKKWINYLKEITPRSIEFTENRLKYGVALESNIKYSPPYPLWRLFQKKQEQKILDTIEKILGRKITRLHDTGCGVGFLLRTARERGIKVTGNDLNKYACQVMRKRFDLNIYNETLPRLAISPGSLDAIIFKDYIEHTYHPLQDLRVASKLLKPNGVIFIETFHIDCERFHKLGKNWKFLFWNHVYHFSTETLIKMVEKADFSIVNISANWEDPIIKIFAKKNIKN